MNVTDIQICHILASICDGSLITYNYPVFNHSLITYNYPVFNHFAWGENNALRHFRNFKDDHKDDPSSHSNQWQSPFCQTSDGEIS